MSLRINSIAPNFTATTTQGTIDFHQWIGDGWAILFSHPKDFTPVCTTELGYLAKLEPDFARRNAKIVGLSIDPAKIAEARGMVPALTHDRGFNPPPAAGLRVAGE